MSKKEKRMRDQYLKVQHIRQEMDVIRTDLNCAYGQLNHITDPKLIDACIYEINALHTRYDMALKHVKSNTETMEVHRELNH